MEYIFAIVGYFSLLLTIGAAFTEDSLWFAIRAFIITMAFCFVAFILYVFLLVH